MRQLFVELCSLLLIPTLLYSVHAIPFTTLPITSDSPSSFTSNQNDSLSNLIRDGLHFLDSKGYREAWDILKVSIKTKKWSLGETGKIPDDFVEVCFFLKNKERTWHVSAGIPPIFGGEGWRISSSGEDDSRDRQLPLTLSDVEFDVAAVFSKAKKFYDKWITILLVHPDIDPFTNQDGCDEPVIFIGKQKYPGYQRLAIGLKTGRTGMYNPDFWGLSLEAGDGGNGNQTLTVVE